MNMNAQLSPLISNFEQQPSTRWALIFGNEHYVQTWAYVIKMLRIYAQEWAWMPKHQHKRSKLGINDQKWAFMFNFWIFFYTCSLRWISWHFIWMCFLMKCIYLFRLSFESFVTNVQLKESENSATRWGQGQTLPAYNSIVYNMRVSTMNPRRGCRKRIFESKKKATVWVTYKYI